jgi:FeS assembly SUF system regulator
VVINQSLTVMLRIGKMSDYALLLTNHLVGRSDSLCTTEDIVKACRLPLATVRKLLKKLVDAQIVISYRGVRGGYRLAREPEDITVAEVISAIEGPIALTECSQQQGACNLSADCELRQNWNYLNQKIAALLGNVSLAQMAASVPANLLDQGNAPEQMFTFQP